MGFDSGAMPTADQNTALGNEDEDDDSEGLFGGEDNSDDDEDMEDVTSGLAGSGAMDGGQNGSVGDLGLGQKRKADSEDEDYD